MLGEALEILRTLLPFRSAWWGQCSDASNTAAPRNWLDGRINLPQSFADEWNAISAGDEFAHSSMRSLGKAIRETGFEGPTPEVTAFSRRHDLYHAAAITLELPHSGLLFFVSLYRGTGDPPFDVAEATLLSEYCVHLLQHWNFKMHDLLLAASTRQADGFALADRHGSLLYLGARLGVMIETAYGNCRGGLLPAELLEAMTQAPDAVRMLGRRVTLRRYDKYVALTLEGVAEPDALSPRERTVATLFAEGRSYKEIARMRDLSPATVRTYLRDAYMKLGVRNKTELGSSLRMPGPPSKRGS